MAVPKQLSVFLEDFFSDSIVDISAINSSSDTPFGTNPVYDLSISSSDHYTNEESFVHLRKTGNVFVKWHMNAPPNFFGAEATGLLELKSASSIKIPDVLCFQDSYQTEIPFIVMEALPLALNSSSKSGQNLAEGVAQLHEIKGREWGFASNNYIGILPQCNESLATWGDFFYQQRLIKQAKMGEKKGWFQEDWLRTLETNKKNICDLLNEQNPQPSLLHGDLWSGNVLWTTTGPALIDPSVYYGCREVDIAFTELFGGFPTTFYDAYNYFSPLPNGYKKRKPILNLYYLLVHANIFGGHYIREVFKALTASGKA